MSMRPQSAIYTLLLGAAFACQSGAPSIARQVEKYRDADRGPAQVKRAAAKSSQILAKAKSDTPTPTADTTSKASKPLAPRLLSRDEILKTEPERLARLGRHVIVGYHLLSDVKALVNARAIAGVFITDHNVRGRKIADIKADLDSLQNIRREQGLPPLVIAADQEGGSVSRL